MWVTKLLISSVKIRIFGPKRLNFVQNMHFRSIWGKYWLFCPFCQMPDQITMRTRCPCGFSVVWVTIFLISPVKIRIFCPKTTKFGPKLAFLVILSFCHLVPCWRVCWWLLRAGCISPDTYLLNKSDARIKEQII